MYIRRLSCSEKGQSSQVSISVSFFQQDLKLDNLDYSIRIFINSHQGLDHFDYIIGVCPYYSAVLGQRKVSEERSSLEKYVEYN